MKSRGPVLGRIGHQAKLNGLFLLCTGPHNNQKWEFMCEITGRVVITWFRSTGVYTRRVGNTFYRGKATRPGEALLEAIKYKDAIN